MDQIITFLTSIVAYFEGVYAAALPAATAGGTLYAVIAIASIFSAGLGLVMVIFRRADGLAVNSAIGQAVLVVLAPMLYAAFFPAVGG